MMAHGPDRPLTAWISGGNGRFLAAPAIVRASQLMPISTGANHALVREMFAFDYCREVATWRFDVLYGTKQFGVDLEISAFGAQMKKPDRGAAIRMLFDGIERMTGSPVRTADLARPAIPVGYSDPRQIGKRLTF